MSSDLLTHQGESIGPPKRKRNPQRPSGPKHRLFGVSSQVLTVDPQDNEEDVSSDDEEGFISEDSD